MAAISVRHRSTSRRHWVSLFRDVAVAFPVGFKLCFLPGELLPTADDHVAVLRLQLNQPRLPYRLLARDQRGDDPAERIENRVARLTAVSERTLDELHWLHRWVL